MESGAAIALLGGQPPTFSNVRIENCAGYAFAGVFANGALSNLTTAISVINCAHGAIHAITLDYMPLSFAKLYIESVNFHGIRVQYALDPTDRDLGELESTVVSCDDANETALFNVPACNSIFKLTVFVQIIPPLSNSVHPCKRRCVLFQ